ncbi:hypothetical protein C5D36_13450 [Rathayibacter sp. AY1C6]|nr:hypothetical protein C5D36_13450 [Rathayibacter sp. AY1C6]
MRPRRRRGGRARRSRRAPRGTPAGPGRSRAARRSRGRDGCCRRSWRESSQHPGGGGGVPSAHAGRYPPSRRSPTKAVQAR